MVEIIELIEELQRSEKPDILRAITVLAQTGMTFSPLLQGLIAEIKEVGFGLDAEESAVDLESGLLQHDELRWSDEQTMYVWDNELWMLGMNGTPSQLRMEGNWNTTPYSLLEEVSHDGSRRQ